MGRKRWRRAEQKGENVLGGRNKNKRKALIYVPKKERG